MTATPATTTSRRERRSIELRERIFRAAVQLFARKGYTETTVEDITNAADVGKGTFFNYFPSKEHTLAAFGQFQIAKVQGAANAAKSTPLPIQVFLRNLALDVLSEPAQNPMIVRALLQANLSSDPVRLVMRDIHTKATALLGQIVEVGQERGEIRKDISPIEIAQVLRQSLLGAMMVWSLFGDGSLESRVENVLKILWNGFAAQPESPAPSLSRLEGTPQ